MPTPRLSTMFGYVMRVGKRCTKRFSPPSGYSSICRVPSRPEHSLKPPAATKLTADVAVASVLEASMSATWKLNPCTGSSLRSGAVMSNLLPLDQLELIDSAPDAEDDELGRAGWRHPDVDHQAALVDVARRVVRIVALDEIGLLRRGTDQP